MSMFKYFENVNMIYRFWDASENVIYVGKTSNILQRFSHHRHLPDKCYNEIRYIDYATVDSKADAKLYELYYISKFLPKYNTSEKPSEPIKATIPELTFAPFKENFSPFLDMETDKIDFSKLANCYIQLKNKKNNTIVNLDYHEYQNLLCEGYSVSQIIETINKYLNDPEHSILPFGYITT